MKILFFGLGIIMITSLGCAAQKPIQAPPPPDLTPRVEAIEKILPLMSRDIRVIAEIVTKIHKLKLVEKPPEGEKAE
jgi:hypothetical protein